MWIPQLGMQSRGREVVDCTYTHTHAHIHTHTHTHTHHAIVAGGVLYPGQVWFARLDHDVVYPEACIVRDPYVDEI